MSEEGKPSIVPAAATQGGDIRGRWPWVEPTVWTESMLTALEEGVKGGIWFSLMGKQRSMMWTVGSECDCEACFASKRAAKVAGTERTLNVGRTSSLRSVERAHGLLCQPP